MVEKGGDLWDVGMCSRITIRIRPLDHPYSTISPLTVTGFSRTGNICDADTENVM